MKKALWAFVFLAIIGNGILFYQPKNKMVELLFTTTNSFLAFVLTIICLEDIRKP
jgi:hypothetical protein